MPGNPGTVLGATVALVAVSAIGVSAGLQSPATASSGKLVKSWIADLTPAQKKARQTALRKCRRIDVKKRRKDCISRVERRFRPKTVDSGPPVEVLVRDKYYSPELVEIRRGGAVRWEWGTENADAHDVTLLAGPKGVSLFDFRTPSAPAVGFTFTRSFEVPGKYRFACSLHHLMRMTVEVGS